MILNDILSMPGWLGTLILFSGAGIVLVLITIFLKLLHKIDDGQCNLNYRGAFLLILTGITEALVSWLGHFNFLEMLLMIFGVICLLIGTVLILGFIIFIVGLFRKK